MKKMLVIIFLLSCNLAFSAPTDTGNGLETGGSKNLVLLILPADEIVKSSGLSDEMIKNRVELTLRKYGIKPEPYAICPWFLGVSISMLKSTYNYIFTITLEFARFFTYNCKGKEYSNYGAVWSTSTFGYCNSTDYILDAIEDQMEIFINDYLEVKM